MYAIDGNYEIADLFLGVNKILERLYQKLYHPDHQIKLLTLKVFSAISGAIENDVEHTFMTVEFMDALESLMTSNNLELKQHANFCFSNLCCSGPKDINKILEHKIFPAFLANMRTEYRISVLKEFALSAANLVHLCDLDQLLQIARHDMIASILTLAENSGKNKNILQLSIRVIGEMADRGELMRQYYGGVNPIVSEISTNETIFLKIANQIEGMTNLDPKTKGILDLIENLLLTHTS